MPSTNGRPNPITRAAIATNAVMLTGALFLGGCGSDGSSSRSDTSGTDAEGGEATTTAIASESLWSGRAPNTEPMAAEDAAAIDEAAAAALVEAEGQLPGLWTGVWDSVSGQHLGAYGNAVAAGAAAAPEQTGRIGSVTKTFTAAAVLRQVDEGAADLDDTVADHLPELAEQHPDIAAVTVEQLLGMTSGIPDYANADWFLGEVVADPTRVWNADEIIGEVLARDDLAESGTPVYSTTNYLILGQILEAVVEGDDPVSTILTDLARQAGLGATAMPAPPDAALADPHSDGYVNQPGSSELAGIGVTVPVGTDVTGWSPSWGGAGGAMYSRLEDLGTWAASGLGTNMLKRSLGDQRIGDSTQVDGAGEYGLGIQVFGNGWIGHVGQIIGWEAIVAYNPDTGDVFVAMVNETASLPAAIEVAFEVFPELAEALI